MTLCPSRPGVRVVLDHFAQVPVQGLGRARAEPAQRGTAVGVVVIVAKGRRHPGPVDALPKWEVRIVTMYGRSADVLQQVNPTLVIIPVPVSAKAVTTF